MASRLLSRNWVEKYRPEKIAHILLPKPTRDELQSYVNNPETLPHILFYSASPGTGKTTTAKALVKEFGSRSLFINASLNANKKTIEDKIANFADTNDVNKKPKFVLLDEVDGSSETQFQDPMKAAIETYGDTVRFIMTANDINSLTEPLLSRMTAFCFDFNEPEEVLSLKKQQIARIVNICKKENAPISNEAAEFLVSKYYPDFRYVVKITERLFRRYGTIDVENIKSSVNNDVIFKAVIDGDWESARQYCIEGIPNRGETFRIFEDSYLPMIEDPILKIKSAKLIGDYMVNHNTVIDKEINIATMLASLIMTNKGLL